MVLQNWGLEDIVPASQRRKSSMELSTRTRQHLAYIVQHSDTVVTVVGVVRAMAKRYRELLQLAAQVEKSGGELLLVQKDAKGQIVKCTKEDFRL